ncbi:uncharacterized protein LOC114257045 [Camellia sinensis]|uniref:uncharacterized protein LOC114257045 n=1 Tax=Camellia sinensis TaxID=4442 RepID=UPI0010356FE9|nr:uncharacterized protein LOC114257045 [Camellia sinensis]
MVLARQRFSMGKEDPEIAENRNTVVAPPRKSVIESVDQWAFLDEIEAPMWADFVAAMVLLPHPDLKFLPLDLETDHGSFGEDVLFVFPSPTRENAEINCREELCIELQILEAMLEKIDEQEDFKLFGTTNSREPENALEILEQREQKLLFYELGRASNLRKSLPWDSAFFTSAGVLDPEELFIINKGFEKAEAHLLPVIQEDLCRWRYVDSKSTLDSDDFSLDRNQSTEVDLFEEIRASIEKSNIMSNICKSVCKSGVGEAHKQETHSLKKLDDISRNRVKSTPTPRRQSVFMQGSKRVKEVVHPQIFQDAEKNGESNSFPHKSPKILDIDIGANQR